MLQLFYPNALRVAKTRKFLPLRVQKGKTVETTFDLSAQV